jgi:hypothetical protein
VDTRRRSDRHCNLLTPFGRRLTGNSAISAAFLRSASRPTAEAREQPRCDAQARHVRRGHGSIRTQRAFFVPRAAVVADVNTDSFRVFAIDDQNHAHLRVVQLDARSSADPARLIRGVDEGERVATSALADLYDGATVSIGETSAQPAPHAETR